MRSMPVLDDRETPAVEVAAAPTGVSAGFAHRAGAFLLREFREMLPPTISFLSVQPDRTDDEPDPRDAHSWSRRDLYSDGSVVI